MKLFVDTSAWAAVFDNQDVFQREASAALATLKTQNNLIYTSSDVIGETITFLISHRRHAVAEKFGRAVQRSPNVRIVHVDQEVWQEAWALFQRYDDKGFSFADCTSFSIMRREKLIDAFTFDHHFEQMGFRLWPGEK
ncbi:MAG TPA: PIN domain-containing protein [Anaerolineae bacterium]